MRLPYKLAALAVLIAIGAGSVATSAAAGPRYSKLKVNAAFFNSWDYGSDPQSVFNSHFTYASVYTLVAVVRHERRSLSIPGRNARVGGFVTVVDAITVRRPGSAPDFEPRHELRECRNLERPPDPGSREDRWLWHSQTGGANLNRGERPIFKRSRNAGLAVNDSGLFIDPGGRSNFWNPGCHGMSVTEPPGHHGLQHPPRIKLPAPKRSRFNGKKPFTYACGDSFEHEMATASDGSPARHSHSYTGRMDFKVRFRPFPSKRLKRVKRRLKKMEGKPSSGNWTLGSEPDKTCP